ncbi:unnamed protein product [Rotaria sp. Silwood2]|nr:unnamed protein product [Rotaria sp. Silwood2]CAF2797822.1 unnamed protein product [Rotaria sp. Silwood2]CAF3213517.1 unnamed protein product [Rotaria sp. Silwood2]CAF4015476.1 unnamed protein product [Rotaria sp. Silwood2]CAF4551637.1 unnamed protein product [Rotaria sp. Silwood2]
MNYIINKCLYNIFALDITTTTAKTEASTVISVYWSLDGVTSDSSNTYNGILISSASYFSTANNQPFVGYGQGLNLSSSSSQYMSVSSPFLDLTYRSFTIEAWIFSTTVYSGDYGIFGQCQCTTCSNQCLYFLVRGGHLFASFTHNDISGSQTLTNNLWYYVTFVYNYNTKQQILYVNGIQDTIKSDASVYQGTNGTIDVGSTLVLSIRNYFNGYIDNVQITTRAKSSDEILTAATLAGYFSFDVPSPYNDYGPNGVNGTQNNTVIVSGRVNQAIRFTGSLSYFYAYGFFQAAYGVYASKSFSVSLWINPTALTASTIVQFSYNLTTFRCHNLIGIFSNYGTTGQIIVQGMYWPIIVGPYITTNTWTHISVTYSFTNGLSLYVNGVYIGHTGSFTFSNSGYITYLQLGFMYTCSSASISNTGYQGLVDEVYVHSRELTQADVTALANA